VNLVTDILPATALIRDPAASDVMERAPRDPREALITWRFGARILGEGALLAAGVLSIYVWTVWSAGAGAPATTMAFTALVLVHPLQAMSCRSERLGWWRLPPNPWMPISLAALVLLQWLAAEWSPLAGLLGTRPLRGIEWLVVAAGVAWPVALLEGLKAWGRATTSRLPLPTTTTPGDASATGTPRND
jgi:Ca2+-transporting ATPase